MAASEQRDELQVGTEIKRWPPTACFDAVVATVAAAQPGRVLVLTCEVDDLTALTDGRGDITVVHV